MAWRLYHCFRNVGLEELSTFSYSLPMLHMPVGLGFATTDICVNIISSLSRVLRVYFYKYDIFLWAKLQTKCRQNTFCTVWDLMCDL